MYCQKVKKIEKSKKKIATVGSLMSKSFFTLLHCGLEIILMSQFQQCSVPFCLSRKLSLSVKKIETFYRHYFEGVVKQGPCMCRAKRYVGTWNRYSERLFLEFFIWGIFIFSPYINFLIFFYSENESLLCFSCLNNLHPIYILF